MKRLKLHAFDWMKSELCNCIQVKKNCYIIVCETGSSHFPWQCDRNTGARTHACIQSEYSIWPGIEQQYSGFG